MGSHVLLIYPPDREEFITPETPPLGLAYLASFVKSQAEGSCKVSILDLNINRITKEEFREGLLKLDEKPDIVGIGGIVTVFNHFLWMSKICKEIFPDSLLVAGGSLASTVPHLLFRHSPVDVCVKGEGEFTLLEIVKSLERGADKGDMRYIKGIFIWDKGKDSLVETSPRPRASDLDIFGMPAYDLLDVEQYAVNGIRNLKGSGQDFPPQILSADNLHMTVNSSRGCVGGCTFCYRQFSKIGMNSTDFLKRHIMFLYNQFGVNIVSFVDELFNISQERMNNMYSCLREIKERIPNFHFRIAARADLISVEFLKKLKEAGCFQIIYGLESGSPKILQMMKKRVTVEQNRSAVIAARDAGLHCAPQFIIGLPGETRETLIETINFIKSIDFWTFLSIHKANAYPGTEIYQDAKNKGLIGDEFAYVSSLAGTGQYPLQLAEIHPKEMMGILRKYLVIRQVRLIFKNTNCLIGVFALLIWITKIAWLRLKKGIKCQHLSLQR